MSQVLAPPAAAVRGPASTLTGARELTRLAIRRDRIMLPVWIYALTAIGASGGYAVKQIYKTPAAPA